MVILPEAVDAWDLLRDVRRFLGSWRPSRWRTIEGQQAAVRLLDAWDRLATGGR